MIIGGLQKISLIDYPGMICAVAFTQGCNFRCSYCHNPELVDPARYGACLSADEVLAFLEKRRGKLDALTISGGEPTIQTDLTSFIKRVRDRGFLIKLDTNGSSPDVLDGLMNDKLVDYIAMDVKGPLDKYETIVCKAVDVKKIQKSIRLIMASGLPYEFRTTVVKSLLQESDILKVGELIQNARL
jgi:pyruvate formate lyase activating enzyme